jgi:hypothetical protein
MSDRACRNGRRSPLHRRRADELSNGGMDSASSQEKVMGFARAQPILRTMAVHVRHLATWHGFDRLSRRSQLAGAEVFKENVGQHPHLALG